jgi:type III secretory pathway component EscV
MTDKAWEILPELKGWPLLVFFVLIALIVSVPLAKLIFQQSTTLLAAREQKTADAVEILKDQVKSQEDRIMALEKKLEVQANSKAADQAYHLHVLQAYNERLQLVAKNGDLAVQLLRRVLARTNMSAEERAELQLEAQELKKSIELINSIPIPDRRAAERP